MKKKIIKTCSASIEQCSYTRCNEIAIMEYVIAGKPASGAYLGAPQTVCRCVHHLPPEYPLPGTEISARKLNVEGACANE